MRIGMGGSAASSMAAGANAAELDFDSVQRGNPEIERRAQEVINHCWALGASNPILAIHDVGAGGISNAFPELVDGAGRGARFDLRAVPLEETGLAPKEIWCNESQERYVLAIAPESLELFKRDVRARALPVCGGRRGDRREAADPRRRAWRRTPVDMPMDVLLGKPPKMHRDVQRVARSLPPLDLTGVDLEKVAFDVLRHPTVASKRFLITIGDRTVGGLNHRDQMVGPWQVPVADCAVTLADFSGFRGEAMSMGERTPLAALNAPASGRMAVGEAITNLLAAPIELERVKLSANWMAACGEPGEDAALYDTVKAVGMELCPALGISVPVGKDSPVDAHRAGATTAKPGKSPRRCRLIVTAFATLADVRGTLTPQLQPGDTTLILIDLGRGQNRMGGTMLAQVLDQFGDEVPDLDDPAQLKALVWQRRQRLARAGANAGVPRPQRRRPVGDGLRNGVCRPRGREPERRHAGHRRRRHQRQPRRIRRLEELGHAGRRAPHRADPARAVQRRAGRRDPGADRGAQRGHADAARARPEPAQPLHRQAQRARRDGGLARCQGGVQCKAARPAPGLGRGELAHREAARQPGLRRCRARAPGRADDPGLHLPPS